MHVPLFLSPETLGLSSDAHSPSRWPAWTLWCARASFPQAPCWGSGIPELWDLGGNLGPHEGRRHSSSFWALMVQTGEI